MRGVLSRRTPASLVAAALVASCAADEPADARFDDAPLADARFDDASLDGGVAAPDAPAPDAPRPTLDAPAPRDLPTPVDAPAPDALDWCAMRINGLFCDGGALHECASNRTARVTVCPDGCFDRGAGSACASDAVDPCFNDPDGRYCGGSIGATLRAGDVWVCAGRRTARIEACAMGCEGAPGSARCTVAAPATDPCERAASGDGAYCGASLMAGDAGTLYECRARRTASSMRCAYGCAVRPPGTPDACNPPPSTGSAGYKVPFACGARVTVTQGNNTAYSHNGTQAWAYDFGVGRGTPVMAMEAGTVTHTNASVVAGGACWNGGGSECANTVNYVVIAHDDGASTLYLHLDAPEVSVGARVTRGQRIGRSGNTGWSSGAHLHVQRQGRCASWFCASQALAFADVGTPAMSAAVTSGNCP
jgi:hypothetical protein